MLVHVEELIFFSPIVTLHSDFSQVFLLLEIVVVVGDVPA
jgi:hypothetical protein